jgi:hypothetical protein
MAEHAELDTLLDFIDKAYVKLKMEDLEQIQPKIPVSSIIKDKLSQFAFSDRGENTPISKVSMESVTFQATTPVSLMSQNKRRAVSPLQDMYQSIQDTTAGDQMDIMVKMIESLDEQMSNMQETIETLTDDNAQLTKRCTINEGRITRHEKIIEDLREELLQVNARSLKDNVVFQNVPEQIGKDVKDVLLECMEKDMKMSEADRMLIHFNKVYRQGANTGARPRDIVINVDDEGKNMIWRHTRNLNAANKISVFTMLPRELADRKRQLVPHYKAAKAQGLRVRWAGEKLMVNGTVKEVKRDHIKDINTDTTERAIEMKVKTSVPKTYTGSSFRGGKVRVENTDDAVSALHAIYADSRAARATHNIYAYRIVQGEQIIEHYEDDGEYGAGRRLLNLLKTNDVKNQLIVVTRWHGGTNLGPSRYNHILDAARDVLGIT